MLYKYCQCGHPIGMEMSTDGPPFYDGFDWDKPIDTCPSCHKPITNGGLEFSAEQSACLHDVYQMLLKWARESDKETT
jgi:hypothetical protein